MSGDLTLAAARLLDWRFLLPSMHLGQVRCGSGCPSEVVDALAAVGTSVEVVSDSGGWDGVPPASADLVVLVEPDLRELEMAVVALRPGAPLYLQVRRRFGGRSGGVSGLTSAHRAVRRVGLMEERSYWHAPDFATCARIIPLDQPVSVRNTLARFDGVRFGRTKSWVGRALLRAKLFPWAVSCGSIVAVRPALAERATA